MTKFQHFIVTPFNVDIGIKPRDYILGEEYLKNRIELFQEVCYESVYHQSNQNFHWLLFIDEETPVPFRGIFNKLSDYPNLTVITTEPNINFHDVLVETIKEKLKPDTEFLITSSLDGDDVININYIQTIQDNFKEQDFEFINFPFGYLLQKNGLFFHQHIYSPFVSLVERINDPIMTAKVLSHASLPKLSKGGLSVKQIVTQPIWLQLIHDHNWLTSHHIYGVLQPPDKIKNNFIIQDFVESYIKISYNQSLMMFIKDIFWKNKYQLTLRKRVNNFFVLIDPLLPKIYLWLALQLRSLFFPIPQLSVNEMKLLCLQQPTYWRKPQKKREIEPTPQIVLKRNII